MFDFAQIDPEEKLLVARLEDLARGAGGRSRFSSFLNERQQLLAQEVIRRRRLTGWMLYGGYPDAVRRMAGFFPEWEQPDGGRFPLTAVTVHLPKGAEPSHRDVLGSLMALGIRRDCLGDIRISGRRCEVFAQDSVVGLILDELVKVGGYGVKCETGAPDDFAGEERFCELRGTVHSLRLDALVSVLTGLAREKGAALIKAELVRQNDRTAQSVSAEFCAGDVITIRGHGKYRVDEIGNPTKKGRLPLLCRKYM